MMDILFFADDRAYFGETAQCKRSASTIVAVYVVQDKLEYVVDAHDLFQVFVIFFDHSDNVQLEIVVSFE
jgi:hypothetical protein